MKYLIVFFLCVAAFAKAEEVRIGQLSLSNVSTTGAPTSLSWTNTSGSQRIPSGEIIALSVDVSASANMAIDFILDANAYWPAKTVYGKAGVTADEVVYPRTVEQNENGTNVLTYTWIPFFNQTITLQASNATTTNQSVTVTFVYRENQIKEAP